MSTPFAVATPELEIEGDTDSAQSDRGHLTVFKRWWSG
jgi:hypothetical protein